MTDHAAQRRPSPGRAWSSSFALLIYSFAAWGCGAGRSELDTSCADRGERDIDLRAAEASAGFMRVHGSVGDGSAGVPVAGGQDVDGDGRADMAFSSFLASPLGRDRAGQVHLVLGDGTIGGVLDTAKDDPRLLLIAGATAEEHAGSEIWIADVTGDGMGDLLIARQDYDAPQRPNAGALSIIPGTPDLAQRAAEGLPIDLAAPGSLSVTSVLGAAAGDRLGIWMRTGDVDGDSVDDVVVGADQADTPEIDAGEVYVLRGGAHWSEGGSVDLAALPPRWLARVARFDPGPDSANFHLGATVQVADLDGNGKAEVLAAAALSRVGATLSGGSGTGGAPGGRAYVLWDDNFDSGSWPAVADTVASFSLDDPPGALTIIEGGETGAYVNRALGEELLAGLDYDADGNADLFLGDLVGQRTDLSGAAHGVGVVLWNAAQLRGQRLSIAEPPAGQPMTLLLGPGSDAIAADTAMHGDFDADGIDDLAVSSPHASALGRLRAGTLHVLWGRSGAWPTVVDLRAGAQPSADELAITDVHAATGQRGTNQPDTLAYSGAYGDLDGDGWVDVITNEMTGDGVLPGTEDVGNLLVMGGAWLACAR